MHARKPAVRPDPPDLLLQVVDRNFTFRAHNYSLYPSWLAYPWPNAHLLIRGTRPYRIERRERGALRGGALQDDSERYADDLDANRVFEALRDFAATATRAATIRLNLNVGDAARKVTGQLGALGCRLASVRKNGELALLGGADFDAPLHSEPGGPARSSGLRVRHRILIPPGAQVRFSLPLELAQGAGRRLRPEFRIEEVEPLPGVFTDSASFRALWPEGPAPAPGQRYRIGFGAEAPKPVAAGAQAAADPALAAPAADLIPASP